MNTRYLEWRPAGLVMVFLGLALAACAAPPPTTELNRANAAIQDAKLDGAEQLAPTQLQTAQGTLAKAQQQVSAENMTQAKYLAEEAEMDAIYADQTALAQRAKITASTMQEHQTGLTKPQ
jgi:hypothetical protein